MTPFSILLVLVSALLHSSWNFLSKKGNWPVEFFFWVFLSGTIFYLLVLMAMQMSKVSYVVAFRKVGALFGAAMGIVLLKEGAWKTRITGVLILTFGLLLIGLSK